MSTQYPLYFHRDASVGGHDYSVPARIAPGSDDGGSLVHLRPYFIGDEKATLANEFVYTIPECGELRLWIVAFQSVNQSTGIY
jgi:hypothetical protein